MTILPVPLIVRRSIRASRDRIFDVFSKSEVLSQWFTPSADISLDVIEFDFVEGGRFRFRFITLDGRNPIVSGVYEQIQIPDQIVMSWVWEAPDPLADIVMRVTFEFLENDEATEIIITHEKIPSDLACTVHEDGWEGSLDSLERHLRKGVLCV